MASRNAGRMILMDIEHELRALGQARLTTDGIRFDSIEGKAWMNRVAQGRKTELPDRLGQAPVRRTIHPRRRLGPVNPITETTSTYRSETRSETTRVPAEKSDDQTGAF